MAGYPGMLDNRPELMEEVLGGAITELEEEMVDSLLPSS